MRRMLSAQDVADAALAAARDGVDRMVTVLQTGPAPIDASTDAAIALIEAREGDGRDAWESDAALSLLIGARTVVVPNESTLIATSSADVSARKQLWKIELIIESDDDAEIERIHNHVMRVACPTLDADTADHECDVPWFVITSLLDDDEAEEWRAMLNR